MKYAEEMASSTKLVLGRGWVKTTADWMATTFASSGSKFTASAGTSIPGAGSITGTVAQHKSTHGPVMNRVGIYAHDSCPENAPYDQCIFMQTCQVKRRQQIRNFLMRGAAGPGQLPDQRDANAGQGGPALQTNVDSGDVSTTDITVSRLHPEIRTKVVSQGDLNGRTFCIALSTLCLIIYCRYVNFLTPFTPGKLRYSSCSIVRSKKRPNASSPVNMALISPARLAPPFSILL